MEFYGHRSATIWHLRKATYRLKTSPHLWQRHLTSVLEDIGCQQPRADRCLFTSTDICLLVYVDDLMIIGTSTVTSEFLQKLEHLFSLKHTTRLKHTTQLTTSPNVKFLGQHLRLHPDGSISIGLEASYYINMLNLTTCATTTPILLQLLARFNSLLTTLLIWILKLIISSAPLLDRQLIWASLVRPDLMYAAKMHSS